MYNIQKVVEHRNLSSFALQWDFISTHDTIDQIHPTYVAVVFAHYVRSFNGIVTYLTYRTVVFVISGAHHQN